MEGKGKVGVYEEWMETVVPEVKQGPVWRFYGYRKTLFLYDLVWVECDYWQKERRGAIVIR